MRLAGLEAIIHVVHDHVGLIAQAAIDHGPKGIVVAQVIVIRGASIHRIRANRRGRAVIWRGITDMVAIGQAVVVGAAALESMVKAKVMSGLVHVDFAVVGIAAKPTGFVDDAVFGLAMRTRKIGVACDAATHGLRTDFGDEPDIEVFGRIPAAQGFKAEVLGFHDDVGEGRLHTHNARGARARRVLRSETKLYVGIHTRKRIVNADIGKGVVHVLDALLNDGIAQIFGSAVMNDVHDNGNGTHGGNAGCALIATDHGNVGQLLIKCSLPQRGPRIIGEEALQHLIGGAAIVRGLLGIQSACYKPKKK